MDIQIKYQDLSREQKNDRFFLKLNKIDNIDLT